MEKREFNRIIKQQLSSLGFEKIGVYDFAKEAQDGKTKIIIRSPDQTLGFGVGAQFKDFEKEYTDYSGKFNKACMYYPVGALLQFAAQRDYSEADICNAVETVMEKIAIFLINGHKAILEKIEEWTFGVENQKRKNDIYAYFNLPLIDPYSKEYQDEWAAKMSGGGMIVLSINEYLNHKAFYDAFQDYDCLNVEICIDGNDNSVTIHFHPKPK